MATVPALSPRITVPVRKGVVGIGLGLDRMLAGVFERAHAPSAAAVPSQRAQEIGGGTRGRLACCSSAQAPAWLTQERRLTIQAQAA